MAQTGSTTPDTNATLGRVRRQARLLEESRRQWSSSDWLALMPIALTIYLVRQSPTEGALLLIATVAGWQHYRLQVRVNALSRLVDEIVSAG